MKESLSQQTANLKHKNNRHKRWKGIVSILACMVVFCTAYALILPALTAEGTPHCGKEEHTHTEDCYEKKLICGKEEGEGAHHHTDECYREEPVLVCTTPESDGHQHTDDCYTEEEVLTCTNKDEDHEHSKIDGCYTTERVLTCGKEEGEDAHYHTEECYETQKILECGQEETAGHQHTAECYEDVLACGKEEHTHTLECYSDSTADVEDESQWSRGFANVAITGNWAKDLTAIAQTQVGYAESDRNYTVNEDNTINGYTRYGQWAGMPYADWSADFTSFCLYYANVPESAVPHNTGCEDWNSSAVSTNGYTPKEGDIILLDGNQDGITDHAGVVTSGSADSVTAIIGDSDKQVRTNTYSTGNAIITGYVPMPENPDFSDGTEEAEPTATPTPEATEAPEATPTETPEVTPTETQEVTEEPTVAPTEAPEITETPEVTPTEIPEVTPTETPEITKAPIDDLTPTPEPTETPEVTPTPEITEIPKVTPTPISKDNENKNESDEMSWCVVEALDANGNVSDENMMINNKTSNIENSNTEDSVENDVALFSIENDYTVMAAGDSTTSKDFGQFITKAKIQKLVNGEWKQATEFENGDQIKAELEYFLPAGVVTSQSKVISYQLPEGIYPLETLTGTVYRRGSDGSEGSAIGTYVIGQDGLIQITFSDEFANDGMSLEGDIMFMGTMSSNNTKVDQKLEFGGDGGSVTIKKREEEADKGDVNIQKTSTLRNDSNTIDYTITVGTTNGTKKEVTVQDWLTNATYQKTSIKVVKQPGNTPVDIKGKLNFSNNETYNASNKPSFKIDQLPALNPGETYEITYTVDAKYPQKDGTNTVENSASSDGKSAWTKVEVSKPKIKKDGSYSEDSGKIKWIITVYSGGKSLEGYQVTDKIDENILNGQSAVLKVKGQNPGTAITLPYTFGKDTTEEYYTIEYETEAPEVSIGSTVNVKNEAEIEKNGEKYDTDKTIGVTKRDWGIGKYLDAQENIAANGNRKYIWKSTITLPNEKIEKLQEFEYTDEIVTGTGDIAHYGILKEVKDYIEQTLQISYIDENGASVSSPLSSCSDWLSYKIEFPGTNGEDAHIQNFKVIFTPKENSKASKYIGKSIEFKYPTIAETSNMKEGEESEFKNKASVSGKDTSASVKYKQPEYLVKESSLSGATDMKDIAQWWSTPSWLQQFSRSGQQNATLGTDRYIYYRIRISPDENSVGPENDIVLTDQIPRGTEFVLDSGFATYCQADGSGAWYDGENGYSFKNSDGSKSDKNPDFNFDSQRGILTITLKKNTCNFNTNRKVAIFYAVKITNDTLLDGTGTCDFTNTVTWGKRTASTTTNVKQLMEKVEKTGKLRNDQDIVDYRIVLNPGAEDLDPESDTLTLEDTLDYETNKLLSVNLDLGSVKLYLYDNTKEDSCGVLIDASKYAVKYDYSQSGKRIMKITLPDSLACVLKYSYQYDFGNKGYDRNNPPKLTNEAKLGSYSSKQTSTNVKDAQSGASAGKAKIVVYKVDSKDYSKFLQGAEFKLYKAGSAGWTEMSKTYTTDEDGKIQFTIGEDKPSVSYDVNYDTLYKLVETQAPANYELSTVSTYFAVLENETSQTILNSASDKIKSELGWNANNIKNISKNGDILYITNDYSTTNVGVEKKWLDENGVAIQPPTDSVDVNLIQIAKTPIGKNVTVQCSWDGKIQETYNYYGVKQGSTIKIKWNKLLDDKYLPGESASLYEITRSDAGRFTANILGSNPKYGYPCFEFPDIHDNITIDIIIKDKWIWPGADKITAEYDQDLSSQSKTYGSVTLNSGNSWKHTWSNLPKRYTTTEGYDILYDYVVEEVNPPSGFSVNYTNNAGIQSGEIIITNVKNTKQDYVLPETGGTGTNRFTAVGLALMAGSLMCGYVMRRKRRERREI